MRRFRPRWGRVAYPLSQAISHAVGRFGGKTKRRLQSLETIIAAVEAERDRLSQELRDLVHYTDSEILELNQTIKELQQERDELQLQLWSLEEVRAAKNSAKASDPQGDLQGDLQSDSPTLEVVYLSSDSKDPTASTSPGDSLDAVDDPASSDLSWLRLALVGGHSATRRGVIQELKGYGLKHCVEIPRMTESNTNRSRVKAKIGQCDLVVIITGYMGHRLSEIVYSLKAADALAGEVLQLSCRGKSGVVREIMKHLGEVQS